MATRVAQVLARRGRGLLAINEGLPSPARTVKPAHLAASFIVLAIASDVTLRQARDTQLALQGSIDLQIAIQLALWFAVAGWMTLICLSGGGGHVTSFTEAGPAVRVLMGASLMVFAASFYAPKTIATIRALQFVEVALLARICHYQLAGSWERVREFWTWVRRGIWLLCGVCAVLGFLSPITDNFTFSAISGQRRYRWFTMHPISVGVLLCIAVVFLAGSFLGVPDPIARRRRGRQLLLFASAAFGFMLLFTKSRGAIAAAVAGGLVLLCLTHNRRLRVVGILGAWAGVAALLVGVAGTQVQNVTLRGQSTDEVLGLTGRTNLFGYAWDLFLDRPVFGHGFLAGRSVYLEKFPWAGESHNAYLELLVSMGLVGFAVFAFLLGRTVRLLWQAQRDSHSPVAALATEGLALVAIALTNGVVGAGFAGQPTTQTLVLAWAVLLADLCWSLKRRDSSPAPTRLSAVRPSHASVRGAT